MKDINIINGNFKEDSLLKKEIEEIDYFKENWDNLNKYENIFQKKISDSNINYDYNKHFLNLDSDDSVDINKFDNNINNDFNNNEYQNSIKSNYNYFKNNIPLTEMKCNIIQLGASIKKYKTPQKLNNTSSYSLKNSIFKVNETEDYSLKNSFNKINIINNENKKNSLNKSQRISFKNNFIKDFDINSKKSFSNKINKNDISSTCFTSTNAHINKIKSFMDIIDEKKYSYKPSVSLRQKNIEKIYYNLSQSEKNTKKENNMLKCSSEINFQINKNNKKNYLYMLIIKQDNKKEKTKKKVNIIKIQNIFNKNKKIKGKN